MLAGPQVTLVYPLCFQVRPMRVKRQWCQTVDAGYPRISDCPVALRDSIHYVSEFSKGCECFRIKGSSHCGRVAQLGEHLLCKQGVTGSIPVTSTNFTSIDSSPYAATCNASSANIRKRPVCPSPLPSIQCDCQGARV